MNAMGFILEEAGPFPPGQVQVQWCDEAAPSIPAMEAMIARTWEARVQGAHAKGIVLFNGQLARYLRHRVEDGTLAIEVGPTDYAAFLGTNYHHPDRAETFGWDNYSNPVGTSATVITSDGWLLYGRRSERVACDAGYVHTFGGGLEAGEFGGDGRCDVFASVLRELDEELGVSGDDVTDMVCVGLIRDGVTRQPELVFDAHVGLTRAEVEGRLRRGGPADEHDAIVGLRDEADAVVPFIVGSSPVARVAVGAICLHGRRCFGVGWYAGVTRSLLGG